jgi:coenzyme F420-reducing hydrogenase beta subunit
MFIKDITQVVEGGFCVGCGACAYYSDTKMLINEYGEYTPDLIALSSIDDLTASGLGAVCPSLNPALNEDEIGSKFFSEYAVHDESLGYVIGSYAGYVSEGDFRANGTSGGMGTWVLVELMRKNLIDGVIHVGQVERTSASDPFYEYIISNSVEEIQANSKTRYHVVELSKVLRTLDKEKKYALVGVPCMIKAVRRLQIQDADVKALIPYTISLVCGHLKSINWSNSLSWGAGVTPNNAQSIQYRTKGDDISARAYVYRVTDHSGNIVQKDSAEVVGGKFNAGSMMLPACEYCDDVVGETADITIGDAWLPRFESDSRGTNLVVTRNQEIDQLIRVGRSERLIELVDISASEAASSQSGGYRQRRDGLSYRLSRDKNLGRLVPEKRIKAGDYIISKDRANIYDGRTAITKESRVLFLNALKANDFSIFSSGLEAEINRLRRLEIMESFWSLLFNKINRKIRSLFKR